MAPGRRAPGGADRHGRPAERLALDLRRPASLEVASGREPHARADLGVRAPESAALAARGLSSGDVFGWREPVLPAGRAAAIGGAGRWLAGRGSADRPRVGPGARLAEPRRVGHAVAVTHAPFPPPGAVALVERSLNGGIRGGPTAFVFVTDRAVRYRPGPAAPLPSAGVVPRDILERPTPGDLVVHIDHGVARYERMPGAATRPTARTVTTSS